MTQRKRCDCNNNTEGKKPMKNDMSSVKVTAKTAIKAVIIATTFSSLLMACSPRISTHGNYPRPEQTSQVTAGTTDKRTVFQLYGPPSTVSTFDQKVWFYMIQQFERFAFFEPEIIEMKVMAVHFDDNEKFVKTETFTLEDIKRIAIEEDITATAGHKLSFFQQMFGNMSGNK